MLYILLKSRVNQSPTKYSRWLTSLLLNSHYLEYALIYIDHTSWHSIRQLYFTHLNVLLCGSVPKSRSAALRLPTYLLGTPR